MSLNDLPTTPITDAVDFADLPEQQGGYQPPPQPGGKRLRLSKLGADNFDLIPAERTNNQGERVRVKFDQHAPLVIIASTFPDEINTPFTTTVTNVPRKRGKGDDAPVASDLDYLLKALKVTQRPASPRAYADAILIASNQAMEFGADIEWSARCNPDREAVWAAEDGSLVPVNDENGQPRKGCGTRVYQRDLPKVDGVYSDRVVCKTCGASVRAFANLTRFRE